MKKIFCIVGIIVGVVMIIMGFSVHGIQDVPNYYTPEAFSFGADYYTDQYEATRDTALNVAYLGYDIQDYFNYGIATLGKFFAMLGAVVVCFFGYKLGGALEESKSAAAVSGGSGVGVAGAAKAESEEVKEAPAMIPERVEEKAEAEVAEVETEVAETAVEAEEAAAEEAAEEVEPVAEEIAEAVEEPATEEEEAEAVFVGAVNDDAVLIDEEPKGE